MPGCGNRKKWHGSGVGGSLWGVAASRPSPKAGPLEIFSWCCYDFANSSYTTVIVTVVYSIFFVDVVLDGRTGAYSLWSWILGLSQAVVIVLSPWLGAVADLTARKKFLLNLTAILCSLFTAALYFTGPGTVVLACALVILANLCFSFGENFCASFLPEISTPTTAGRISGYGWSFGYMGGLVSLGLALLILHYGPEGTGTVRWIFAMTGAFFLVAALPTMLILKERAVPAPEGMQGASFREGWKQLGQTLHHLRQHRVLAWFFASFLCFISGLSAVFAFAAIFATKEFGFSQEEVIGLFASLQVSSALGAFAFGFIQDKTGAKVVLCFSILVWVVVCVGASFAESKWLFFAVGNVAGLVMGSTQSASRAVVAQLAPEGRSGEFFGFWGLFGKLAAIIGPVTLGALADLWTLRVAVAVNALFFLAGLVILSFIPLRKPGHGSA